MKEMSLFDDINYKHIKDYIDDDDNYMEVEIEDLYYDKYCPACPQCSMCKTQFKFTIRTCVDIMKIIHIIDYDKDSDIDELLINLSLEEYDREMSGIKTPYPLKYLRDGNIV
tara:strand:+ start:1090 stop:1425 length:336 start_codon:yes stop_codon:yes gene_type:complete